MALATGETPEWVAKTLGHVGSAMVLWTYGRYIPNLTRQDGFAFERQYDQATKGEGHTESAQSLKFSLPLRFNCLKLNHYLVEAGGVEPPSGNIPSWRLHT